MKVSREHYLWSAYHVSSTWLCIYWVLRVVLWESEPLPNNQNQFQRISEIHYMSQWVDLGFLTCDFWFLSWFSFVSFLQWKHHTASYSFRLACANTYALSSSPTQLLLYPWPFFSFLSFLLTKMVSIGIKFKNTNLRVFQVLNQNSVLSPSPHPEWEALEPFSFQLFAAITPKHCHFSLPHLPWCQLLLRCGDFFASLCGC